MASVGLWNTYLVYEFMKRLLSSYTSWDAFKSGVLDKNGKIIVPENKRTAKQKASFKLFDLLVLKIRHLLDALPGGPNRLKNTLAAIWALREGHMFFEAETLNESVLEDSFMAYMQPLLTEDGPACASGGMAGGTTPPSAPDASNPNAQSPPISRKKQKAQQQSGDIGRRKTPGTFKTFVTAQNALRLQDT